MTEFRPGDRLRIGPFQAATMLLPHWLPNAGLGWRPRAGCSPIPGTAAARRSPAWPGGADLLLAEATYPDQVPPDDQPFLSSARAAGQHAAQAGVARLLLTHLWPGTGHGAARAAAAAGYDGDIGVASAGLATEV